MRALSAGGPGRASHGGPAVSIGLTAVILTVRHDVPRVLTVADGAGGAAPPADVPALDALPCGPLDPARHATLERGLLRWVREQTGLELDYVEQLYTFGDRFRDPGEASGGPRVVSVAYLVLVEAGRPLGTDAARWRDGYAFFPWEDWRAGRPAVIDDAIVPALHAWAAAGADDAARAARHERVAIAFGLGAAPWDGERVLDRYELLYEVGLVAEAHADLDHGQAAGVVVRHPPWLRDVDPARLIGRPLARDHRRILATAIGRVRGKLKYRPVVFELLPPTFTLLQLQRVVEALGGVRLHTANFRRLVEQAGLVEGTGEHTATGGRPAERFRFRREVLRERRAAGVGLPEAGGARGA